MNAARKAIAYVDRDVHDEVLEIGEVEVLPARGATIYFADGDARGLWSVWQVKPLTDAVFDADVILERMTT